MSGTIDSATSAITSARCRRRMPGADVPLRPERNGSMCSRRVKRSAGIDPQTRHTIALKAIANDATVPLDAELRLARQVGRPQPVEHLDATVGDRQACRHAAAGQQRALGQQLRDDAQRGGAERGAHRNLALARLRARQQQVGDVDARDQQHERHGHAEGRSAPA